MTVTYKKFKDPYGKVVTVAINKFVDGVHVMCIPTNPLNRDYAEFLEWEAIDGNTLQEAD